MKAFIFGTILSGQSNLPPTHSNYWSLTVSVLVAAVPPFDPAGATNFANGLTQFIGGQCANDAECASGCCANPTGICSGVGAAFQNGKTGCGFPGASTDTASSSVAVAAVSQSTSVASTTPANGGPAFDPAGETNFENGLTQFIGGQCANDAQCASACCAGPSGICSGVGAQTQNGKTGWYVELPSFSILWRMSIDMTQRFR